MLTVLEQVQELPMGGLDCVKFGLIDVIQVLQFHRRWSERVVPSMPLNHLILGWWALLFHLIYDWFLGLQVSFQQS